MDADLVSIADAFLGAGCLRLLFLVCVYVVLIVVSCLALLLVGCGVVLVVFVGCWYFLVRGFAWCLSFVWIIGVCVSCLVRCLFSFG